MKNSMILFLTAIILALMIQPVTAQNLRLEKGVTHPHAINMINVSTMNQMAEECMQLCRGDEDHGQVIEHMSKMPDTMDEKYGHHEMMENMNDSGMDAIHEKCMAMMHDRDKQDVKTDSDDHENHH